MFVKENDVLQLHLVKDDAVNFTATVSVVLKT